MLSANATRRVALSAQNRAIDAALDRCPPRTVATFASVRASGPARREQVICLDAEGRVERVSYVERAPMVSIPVEGA